MNPASPTPFSTMEGSLQEVLTPASRPTLQIYQALLVFLLSVSLVLIFMSSDIVERVPVHVIGMQHQGLIAPGTGPVTYLDASYRCAAQQPVLTVAGMGLVSNLAGRISWSPEAYTGASVSKGDHLGDITSTESRRAVALLTWDQVRDMSNLTTCHIVRARALDRGLTGRVLGSSVQPDGTIEVTIETDKPLSSEAVYMASFEIGRAPLWRVLFTDPQPKGARP